MLKLKLKTVPTSEPLSITQAKSHLRVDISDDDTLITALIIAARQMAEEYTQRQFMTATYQLYLNDFKTDILLPKPPYASFVSAIYEDTDSVSQTLAVSEYLIDNVSEPSILHPAYNTSFPGTNQKINNVIIEYVAGYTSAALVPGPIKAAILLIIGHLYENREDVVVGRQVNDLPKSSKYLLDPYRIFRFQ